MCIRDSLIVELECVVPAAGSGISGRAILVDVDDLELETFIDNICSRSKVYIGIMRERQGDIIVTHQYSFADGRRGDWRVDQLDTVSIVNNHSF